MLESLFIKRTEIIQRLADFRNYSETITSVRRKTRELIVTHDELIKEQNELLKENELLLNKLKLSSADVVFRLKEREFELSTTALKKSIEESIAFITSRETLEERKKALELKRAVYETAIKVWNTSTGYPSLLIKDFLDEVVDVVNEDLEYVWGGLLSIKEFILEEGEFRIPIIRGNTVLDDVLECSKAEKAILSMSISFGIIKVSLENSLYNILRLDEIDGGMDSVRRELFFEMLKRRLEDIQCHNAFAITHNNSFSNVEADVILLKGYDTMCSESDLSNKNVIYKYAIQ
jgi:DNA repair exonuclease SbcCD ATPase subunit